MDSAPIWWGRVRTTVTRTTWDPSNALARGKKDHVDRYS